MKKWILFLANALMFSFNAYATDVGFTSCPQDTKGNTPNCQYKIENGTLTIKAETGQNGNIGYWHTDNGSQSPFAGLSVQQVVIDDSISDLGSQAFTRLHSMTPVSVPSSVNEIGYYALHGISTSEVIIPNSVKTISTDAFSWSYVNKIDIPDSVTSIGNWAFRGSSLLTDLVIPDSVTSIGYTALSALPNLKTLSIGENTILKEGLFQDPYTQESSVDNLKIYCMGDTVKCDANLRAAGYPELKSVAATTKKIDGKTYVYVNGKRVDRVQKRIYTIDEAQKASKDTGNTFMLRYK